MSIINRSLSRLKKPTYNRYYPTNSCIKLVDAPWLRHFDLVSNSKFAEFMTNEELIKSFATIPDILCFDETVWESILNYIPENELLTSQDYDLLQMILESTMDYFYTNINEQFPNNTNYIVHDIYRPTMILLEFDLNDYRPNCK